MFLRNNNRRKDGKDHRYYSIVENRRLRNGKIVQKTLLYLGEINDSQKAEWTKSIDTFHGRQIKQIALFPSDREFPVGISSGIKLDMSQLDLLRPRQWGACWLACELWEMLRLNEFWKERLPPSRDKRKFGYSRDKRPDCVQVVIALVVTPEGFPIAYEVLPGNTLDKTTLRELRKSG